MAKQQSPVVAHGILLITFLLISLLTPPANAQDDATAAPGPVQNLRASDIPWDAGTHIKLEWDAPADGAEVAEYWIHESIVSVGSHPVKQDFTKLVDIVPAKTAQELADGDDTYELTIEAKRTYKLTEIREQLVKRLDFEKVRAEGVNEFEAKYVYRIFAKSADGVKGPEVVLETPIVGSMQIYDASRLSLMFIAIIFCGAVIFWIMHARSGKPVKVRKIAGLEAVDEAVGRATEMGRSVLFVPGIQDINEIQTIAGLTILARVSKTAAEFDAKIEVPTSKSLVMTTARETVQAAFMAAGRPDAYNKDLIYYVTDEQFGYVAYLQGMMVREKPATCFYMGAFFAESLILAETGNSIGAIQIAGTAMPAQLPFFVAACDYTLIGEEFFAASAYLSGSAEELGSLKGQDVGKLIVAFLLIIGVVAATLAAITNVPALGSFVDFLKNTILT